MTSAPHSDSTINISGTPFVPAGVELSGLALGEAFTITDRNVTLSGLLAIGAPLAARRRRG